MSKRLLSGGFGFPRRSVVWGRRALWNGLHTVRRDVLAEGWSDEQALRHAARVSVWWRWGGWVVAMTEAAYNPDWDGGTYAPFVLLHLVLVAGNALVHYRAVSGRSLSWAGVLGLSAIDFVMVTSAVFADGGFSNFYYIVYYPSLALVAVVCPSVVVGLLWTTLAVGTYGAVCLAVDPGLDLVPRGVDALIIRLGSMYAVVLGVNLVVWHERQRRRDSEGRERALLRQGLEASQIIHDTVGQTAYALGLGVERARGLAGDRNEELSRTLAASSALAKSIIWELRLPIDNGLVLRGSGLREALQAHTETFGRVASLSAELVQLEKSLHCPWTSRPACSRWHTMP